jgi:DNA polymerase-3 subunit delta'
MQMNEIQSWQKTKWHYLIHRKKENHLPHAFLFTGNEGLGKWNVANLFAKLLLCRNTNNDNLEYPCQSCSSCQLINAGTHPDLLIVQKGEKEKAIRVDQIRELIAELYQTSSQGGAKIALINATDNMNIAASNALLKTLEEPPAGVYIILISANPALLPATIRSRCQTINFKPPTSSEVKEWLVNKNNVAFKDEYSLDFLMTLAGCSPFKVLTLLQNREMEFRDRIFADFIDLIYSKQSGIPARRARDEHAEHTFYVCEQCERARNNAENLSEKSIMRKIHFVHLAELYMSEDLTLLLLNLTAFLTDILKVKLKANADYLFSRDKIKELNLLAELLNVQQLYQTLDKIFNAGRLLSEGINLNKQLLLEGIFSGFLKPC